MINAKPSEVKTNDTQAFDGGISVALVRALAATACKLFQKSALSRKKNGKINHGNDVDGELKTKMVQRKEGLFQKESNCRAASPRHVCPRPDSETMSSDSKKYNLPEPMCRWVGY